MNSVQSLTINSTPNNYTVDFVDQIEVKKMINNLRKNVYAVIDSNIHSMYGKYIEGLELKNILVLFSDENLKTFQGVERVCNWLLESGAKKDSIILGIGGGVIQDVCTFVSHIYYRGIQWIYLPTTLLSQCDSCIGAKCGINLGSFKNQLGVIHAPSKVWIDTSFLESLNEVDILSGLGEMLKLSLTGPNHFYSFFKEGLKNSKRDFKELVYKSLCAKQPIIEDDEFENDLRRILNYGHSFGHALEHCFKGKVPHGLAVVWGIDLINYVGLKLNITPHDLFTEIRNNLKEIFKFSLPLHPDIDELFEALSHDKKIKNNKINFAILEDIGKITIRESQIDYDLKKTVQDYLKSDYVFRPA